MLMEKTLQYMKAGPKFLTELKTESDNGHYVVVDTQGILRMKGYVGNARKSASEKNFRHHAGSHAGNYFPLRNDRSSLSNDRDSHDC